MTRPLIILASSLLLGSGVAVPQGDPGSMTATFETASATVQAIPQNAPPSRRGGRICDGGYVKRDRASVTVDDGTDAEVRQQIIATSIESYSGLNHARAVKKGIRVTQRSNRTVMARSGADQDPGERRWTTS